jgi:hypothetical protein
MIEIRVPTPSEEKLELLTKYQATRIEVLTNWGSVVYIQLFRKDLRQLKKFIIDNGIAKAENIEEIQSGNWPCNPVEKITLLMEYLKKNNIDFTVHANVKLPKKDLDAFVDWQIANGFEEK